MKIKSVESTTVALPLKYTLRHSGGAHPGRLVFTVVRVETDEGITGYGETGGGGFSLAPFVDSLRAQLVGEDPFNVRRLRYKVASPITATYYNQLLPQIWFPIETALLDIKGKSLGVPVHDLLGGSMRDEVGVSAYVFHTEKSYTPEAVAQEAKDLADQYGFNVIKLKAGVFKPQHDADTAIAVAEKIKGAKIRVDPNGAWSLSEALWFASEMRRASVNIEYMEDPVWTMEDMREFRRATGYAVATNTVVTRFEDIPNAFLREAVDVVLGDPHWWYGMMGYLELAASLWSLGMELGMHSPGESGLGLTAMIHAAACAPNLAYAIDTHHVHLADDLIKEKLVIRNGRIQVPNKPGLGVTVDEAKLDRYAGLFKEEGGYSYSSDSARGAWIPTIPRGSYDSCPCHPG